eukprot:6287267-Ditylum_brightwellii.AAC.1
MLAADAPLPTLTLTNTMMSLSIMTLSQRIGSSFDEGSLLAVFSRQCPTKDFVFGSAVVGTELMRKTVQ